MSSLPPEMPASRGKLTKYGIICDPELTVLNKLFCFIKDQSRPIILVLRSQDGNLRSATVVTVDGIEQDPIDGAVHFGGTLETGGRIQIRINPGSQTDEIVGHATIRNPERTN